jgi:phytoene dehydrogenase-like protein
MLDGQVGEDVGAIRARTYPRGGIGAIAAALAGAARANGVEIRTGAAVARVIVRNGRADGVVLQGSGDEILARAVASSADPRHTFLTLAGPTNLEPEFVRAVRNVRHRGVTAKVNLALSELPKFAGVDGEAKALAGVIGIAPSLDYLEHAYDDAKHGRVSSRPYLEATIPSLLDESLAPRGHHVMSVRMQYAPYRPTDGAWTEDRRAALCDSVVETIGQYAPDFADSVVAHQVLTPADIECVFGSPEGNLDHVEMALDQVMFMRPVPGWARYRTPIDDLFLCGASAHPGGRVVGGAGRLAARAMVRGRKAR